MQDKGQHKDNKQLRTQDSGSSLDNFVLDKSIFSNIFEKDIKRVYIYKKAERLAKAIHLVAPAFRDSPALRDRVDLVAVGLVDAATLPPITAREALSRELLALSSVLSIARVGGLLSSMNAELIAREAHQLLQEIAGYEEPRLFLDDAPTLATLFKAVGSYDTTPGVADMNAPTPSQTRAGTSPARRPSTVKDTKGHISDNSEKQKGRRDAIVSLSLIHI